MEELTQSEDDELWDHYSGLPNPMWYQYSKEIKEENEESREDKKQIEDKK